MRIRLFPSYVAVAIAAGLCLLQPALRAQAPSTPEETEQFLLTAEIVEARQIGQGSTNPWRLTLSNGTYRHDAAFQSVDVRLAGLQRVGPRTEVGFADSYHFNIAAYRLARLLGLGEIVPPTVEREWRGRRGALSWWILDAFDERARMAAKRQPPVAASWFDQTQRMHVFGELVYDTDRNQTNILYTEVPGDWKLWMIDFTRAFRPFDEIRQPDRLTRISRELIERMRALDGDAVRKAVGPHLTAAEFGALMARRDLIVAFVDKLVVEKGEAAVLY
jgi:hypothetical protein